MCVSTSGEGPSEYQDLLGEYQWTKDTRKGYPVYVNENNAGRSQLQVNNDGLWSICKDGYCGSFWIVASASATTTPDREGWTYRNSSGEWADDTITVRPCNATSNYITTLDTALNIVLRTTWQGT